MTTIVRKQCSLPSPAKIDFAMDIMKSAEMLETIDERVCIRVDDLATINKYLGTLKKGPAAGLSEVLGPELINPFLTYLRTHWLASGHDMERYMAVVIRELDPPAVSADEAADRIGTPSIRDVLNWFHSRGRFLWYDIMNFAYKYDDIVYDWNTDWETGYEIYAKYAYVRFHDLFITDIDYPSPEEVPPVEEFVLRMLHVEGLWVVHRTYKGYHLIRIDKPIPHYSEESVILHDILGSDPMYQLFCYSAGYKLRVSPKPGRPEQKLYTFEGTVGKCKPDPRCTRLLHVLETLSDGYVQGVPPTRAYLKPLMLGSGFAEEFINGSDDIDHSYTGLPREIVHMKMLDTIVRLGPFNPLPDKLWDKTPTPLLKMLYRPQQLLDSKADYFVAREMVGGVVYICYKDLMMIDVDIAKYCVKGDRTFDSELARYLKFMETRLLGTDLCFMVYRSRGGLHLFDVSTSRPHRSMKAIRVAMDFGADTPHVLFSYIRGYCCRLNRHSNSTGPVPEKMYTFLGYFGGGKHVERLVELTLAQFEYIDLYEHMGTINITARTRAERMAV